MPSTTKSKYSSFNTSSHIQSSPRGFTLIEIAVVLVIVGLLISSILGPLSSQQTRKNIQSTETLIQEAEAAILGYLAQNGHLPCPATITPTNSNGAESRVGGANTNCRSEHGFIPNADLGLNGIVDANNILTDHWGNPIRYSLTSVGTFAYAIDTFNISTLSATAPDIQICNNTACATTVATNIAAVIFSLGPDASQPAPFQSENIDNLNAIFVNREPSEAAGAAFDDILTWISSNQIAYTLVESGQAN